MPFEAVPVTAVIPKNSVKRLFGPHYTEGHSKCHNGTPGYFHLLSIWYKTFKSQKAFALNKLSFRNHYILALF